MRNGRTLLARAATFLNSGLSVIAVKRDDKRPTQPWKPLQKRLATDAELEEMFGTGEADLAVVTGAVSDNLEVLDFDQPGLIESWLTRLPNSFKEKLPIVSTPSGGAHVYYRCCTIAGNTKLAVDPNLQKSTLIETRGEGGYVVTIGAIGREQISGPAIPEQVPRITVEERRLLLTASAHFDQRKLANDSRRWLGGPHKYSRRLAGLDLGLTWTEVLSPHGWSSVDGVHWTRPGKSEGVSAVVRTSKFGSEVLVVFSTNAGPLACEGTHRTFSLIDAFACLNFHGDRQRAWRELRSKNGGQKTKWGVNHVKFSN